MSDEKAIERLAMTALDTARAMLDEYGLVIPFGIRVFHDSEDVKMNCPADQHREADWQEQIDMVAEELRGFIASEQVLATALVTSLQAGEEMGIGLQVETGLSAALFIYPYAQEDGKWNIEQEPVQNEPMLARVFHVADE